MPLVLHEERPMDSGDAQRQRSEDTGGEGGGGEGSGGGAGELPTRSNIDGMLQSIEHVRQVPTHCLPSPLCMYRHTPNVTLNGLVHGDLRD